VSTEPFRVPQFNLLHAPPSEEEPVSSSSLIRLGGGLASIVSGILLVVGHLLNLGGDPEYGTVLGESSVLTAHVALVFALVALYAAQAEWSGLPGSTGMVLGVACSFVLAQKDNAIPDVPSGDRNERRGGNGRRILACREESVRRAQDCEGAAETSYEGQTGSPASACAKHPKTS
jgi:hypothetical protein